MLPLGIRTLPQIEAERDLVRRVRDAGVLLRFLLANFEPDATDDHGRRDLDLATRVKRNEKLFADGLPDLLHAVQAGEAAARGEPLLDEAKKRAAARLTHAARVVLTSLPDDLCREVHGAPEPRPSRGEVARDGDQTETLARAALFRDLLRFARLAAFIVIAGAVVFGAVKLPALLAETPADVQARKLREQAKREAAARNEIDNALRADIAVLVEQARNAEALAKEFVKETERFGSDVEPLLVSEPGKIIAADPTGVETIVALLDRSRPTKEDASRLVQRINRDLLSPLVASLKQRPPLRPDPSRASQIESAAAEARAGVAAYRELRLAFEALLAEGRKSGRIPADNTLAAAIQEARQGHFLREQHTIQKAAEQRRNEAAARLVEAERAKAAADAQIEEQKRLAEAAARQRELDAIKTRAEADRLRAQAREPVVLALYSQFLSPGHVYFRRNGGERYYRADIAQPMSLSMLKDFGAMADWRVFAAIAAKRDYEDRTDGGYRATSFSKNDRPGVWGYPSTQADVEVVIKRMRAFEMLAPYWIEQGKLRP